MVSYRVFSLLQKSVLCLFSFPICQPLATTDLSTVSIVFPVSECHVVGIIQYVAFSDWLLSLSNMHLSFLHVLSWVDSSFFSA